MSEEQLYNIWQALCWSYAKTEPATQEERTCKEALAVFESFMGQEQLERFTI